jgi:hypothetical protein
MAEFCTDCRFRGDCDGEFDSPNVAQFSVSKSRGKLFRRINALVGNKPDVLEAGTYAMVQDQAGNTSEIFPIGVKTTQEVVRAIGSCSMPRKQDVCGAFPEARRPYEETVAATIMSKPELEAELQEQLIEG